MFKKPLGSLKTSAPLRSSDWRKLKQRLRTCFPAITHEDEDAVIPEGLMSVKFNTHLQEPGVAYLAPNGNPLWFTIGKNSDELIPTVYTLWTQPNILPSLSTPAAVIPVLIGGADLMIPGVVQHPPSLPPDQLVSITQYHSVNKIGPPLGVGRMALPSNEIKEDGKKGKAVFVLHTWKDSLWELGSGGDVPEAREIDERVEKDGEGEAGQEAQNAQDASPSSATGVTALAEGEARTEASGSILSPQEVTTILRTSLLQAISATLSKLSPATFPITATIFYSSYILPSRPFVHPSSSSATPTPIDIKNSSHKSLTTFLKAAEKEGLIKLKDQKGTTKSKSSDLVITGVFPKHADVLAHKEYKTLKEVEDKRAKKEEREEGERKKVKEMAVRECWKPWQASTEFFAGTGSSTSTLYTLLEIKAKLSHYISSHNLVNPNDQSYINVDALLSSALSSKTDTEPLEFLKRDELTQRLVDKMQAWYEISLEGKEPMIRKGSLKPISVVAKKRQNSRVSTLIVNFEPFSVSSDFLAEELKRICACATFVSPVQGKASAMEVLVQGNQIRAITELLISKGVPKKWIESVDLTVSAKKKAEGSHTVQCHR